MKAKKCNGRKNRDTDTLFPDSMFIVFDEKHNKIFKRVDYATLQMKYR